MATVTIWNVLGHGIRCLHGASQVSQKKSYHKVLPLWIQTTSMRCSSQASYRGGQSQSQPDSLAGNSLAEIWPYQWLFLGFPQKIILPMCWWLQSRSFPLSQTAQRTSKDNNKLVFQSVRADVACYIMYVLGQWVKNLWLSSWCADAGPLAMGPKWGRCRSIHSLLIPLRFYLVCSLWP